VALQASTGILAMSQAAKAQEPSVEEILASIRRIIADDDTPRPGPEAQPGIVKPSPVSPLRAPAPPPAAAASPPEPEAMSQDDIDAMLAGFDSAPASEAPAAEPASADEDVLHLTPSMEARSESADDQFQSDDTGMDVMFREAAEAAQEESMPYTAERTFGESRSLAESPLLSQHATAAVSSAFGSLAHTVLVQNARTLDDLVRDMLQPMLKTWLDDNLPTIVERLVRAEIERVSRGRS
jgi:uncharacterized protein